MIATKIYLNFIEYSKPTGHRLTKQGPPSTCTGTARNIGWCLPGHLTVTIKCLHGHRWNQTVSLKSTFDSRPSCFNLSNPSKIVRSPSTFRLYLNFVGCRPMTRVFSCHRPTATAAWQAPYDFSNFMLNKRCPTAVLYIHQGSSQLKNWV